MTVLYYGTLISLLLPSTLLFSASLQQSGLEIPDGDVLSLTGALFDEAVAAGNDDGDDVGDRSQQHIDIDQLKNVFANRSGLLDSLGDRYGVGRRKKTFSWIPPPFFSCSLTQWLIPSMDGGKKKKKSESRVPGLDWARERLQWRHVSNNWQLFLFLACVAALNVVLFVARACEFIGMRNLWDDESQNFFYLLSRACGRTLLLQSVLVFVLVLRYTITKLRNLGASSFLPLDHNIYVHKVVGISIFVYSWVHAIMHIINFCESSIKDTGCPNKKY